MTREEMYEKGMSLDISNDVIDSIISTIKDMWSSIKNVVKNIFETFKNIFSKIHIYLSDKEYRKLCYMESKVKTKRLKKKYRDKKIKYLVMKYSILS